jgi:hypothetical protein
MIYLVKKIIIINVAAIWFGLINSLPQLEESLELNLIRKSWEEEGYLQFLLKILHTSFRGKTEASCGSSSQYKINH